MGWVWTQNDEHQGRNVAAIAVSSPTDDDVHEVVDRYAETTTGYCAARVHDTDLQAALAAGALVGRGVAGGVDTACGAGVSTWLTPVVDLSGWSECWFWWQNTGANAAAAIEYWFFLDVAGTIGFRTQLAFAFAPAAIHYLQRTGATSEWVYRPSVLGALACRLALVGGANPTTAKAWVVSGRN